MATAPASTPAGAALCEARGVSQDFPISGGAPLRVLEDVSLSIRPREVVALLGPSGCGKSTILRILAGLIRPTRGEVLYHGRPLAGLNPGVAIVFQSFALYPWLTVEENVRVVLRAAGLKRDLVESRASNAIRLVGLSGFEDSYPRQLSGGMKQRVGMARALSVDPEILFMDEPFSQVDALTAESLRAEVLDIWSGKDRGPSSILMVSHDIKEVVFMADRICLLAANPGRVLRLVENPLPRPRDYRSPELVRLVDHLHEVITGHEMPDALPSGPEPELPEVLPEATTSEIVGLLEYLDARGGRDDVFRIAADTEREFGQVISVVKAAELLDFIDTPKRLAVLAPDGVRFVRGTAEERQRIWREQLLKLSLFREVRELVHGAEDQALDAEEVRALVRARTPHENPERMLMTLARWGRFGNLFSHDEATDRLVVPD